MDLSTKKDLKISFLVGIVAGVLMLPTLRNLGVILNLKVALLATGGLTVFTPVGYLVAYWLSKRWPVLLQFVKFGIVGGLNAMIDLGVLNLLIYFSGLAAGFWYSVFKSVSFITAVFNSYFWNKYWTFKSENRVVKSEFLKFFLVNLFTFALNVGTASVLVNVVGKPAGISAELWANVGAVSAVFISLFINFLGMKFIVFKR
ncbi:MAG: GtrA family protein [Candidatus Harrisonbacteria bacterium]|nr:GtrA family protein [Candidatus Harrisonbacteria bacterium]